MFSRKLIPLRSYLSYVFSGVVVVSLELLVNHTNIIFQLRTTFRVLICEIGWIFTSVCASGFAWSHTSLHWMVMFLGALVDSKKPEYQKYDIDFLIGDLLKRATIRNTDRVPKTNNKNKSQENNSLREDNDLETDSGNDC